MQTVILAGGQGTRLFPITRDLPKPMAPVKGKPFLEYLLLLLKRNSLKKILLCVGHLGEKIETYFGDGQRLGLEIKYSYEKELLGTAGALKLAADLIEEEFLLLYGDSYLDMAYSDFINFFEDHKTTGSLAIYDNTKGDSGVQNNIALCGSQIIKYDKRNQDSSLSHVEAGVSIFKKGLLDLIEPGCFRSLENDIFPGLIANKQLSGYEAKTRFFDIGSLDGLNHFANSKFKP